MVDCHAQRIRFCDACGLRHLLQPPLHIGLQPDRQCFDQSFFFHADTCVSLLHNCKKKLRWVNKCCYTKNMALGSQLPIRLDPSIDARLQAAAEQAGTSKSALIRMLAKTFVDQCVEPNGRVTLPPNWHDLLPARDARSCGQRIKQVGSKNIGIVNAKNFTSAPDAAAPGPEKGRKGKRGTGNKTDR